MSGVPIVTYLLIAVTAGVSLMAFNNGKLMQRLLLWPPAIERRRQYDRLLTHGFVHADQMHLFFNMFTLFFFGRALEPIFTAWIGPIGFLGFYLSAIVVAILPSYLRHRHDPQYSSLGASGAVSALVFSSILFDPWSWFFVLFVPMPAIGFAILYVAYSVWMDKRGGGGINHSAHLAGAAYGILFTVLLRPAIVPHFLQQLTNPTFPSF